MNDETEEEISSMDFQMSSERMDALLNELCIVLGFGLSRDAITQLKSIPVTDVDDFADEVLRAGGLNPYADIPQKVRHDMRKRIAAHIKEAEDEFLMGAGETSDAPKEPEKLKGPDKLKFSDKFRVSNKLKPPGKSKEPEKSKGSEALKGPDEPKEPDTLKGNDKPKESDKLEESGALKEPGTLKEPPKK